MGERKKPTKLKLGKALVDGLTPTDQTRVVWDSEQRGFGVRITPTGAKAYVAAVRVHGQLKWITLGKTTDLACDAARKLAAAKVLSAAAGADPTNTAIKRGSLNVSDAFVDFIAAKRRDRKAGTVDTYLYDYNNHVRSHLGSRKVASLNQRDASAIKDRLASSPSVAGKVLRMMSSFVTWCSRNGHFTAANPFSSKVELQPRVAPRTRYLDHEETARLARALDTTKANPYAVAAIRLYLLLGLRLREALLLRWQQVDFTANVLRLDHAKGKGRVVHLNTSARAVLAGLPRMGTNPHVFPGNKPNKPLQDIRAPFERIMREAGIVDLEGKCTATRHDLRRTFGSLVLQAGVPMAEVSRMLGHSSIKVTEQVYAFLGDDALRAAATKADNAMSAAMSGTADPAKVIPMRRPA